MITLIQSNLGSRQMCSLSSVAGAVLDIGNIVYYDANHGIQLDPFNSSDVPYGIVANVRSTNAFLGSRLWLYDIYCGEGIYEIDSRLVNVSGGAGMYLFCEDRTGRLTDQSNSATKCPWALGQVIGRNSSKLEFRWYDIYQRVLNATAASAAPTPPLTGGQGPHRTVPAATHVNVMNKIGNWTIQYPMTYSGKFTQQPQSQPEPQQAARQKGANCQKCNEFNEYNDPPFTCYRCRMP